MDNHKRNRKLHQAAERSTLILNVDLSVRRISYNNIDGACGTYTNAKEKGLVRLEGKEYVVKRQRRCLLH